MKPIALAGLCGILVACAPMTAPVARLPAVSGVYPGVDQVQGRDAFETAFLAHPDLAGARLSLIAARHQTQALDASLAPQVNVEAGAGLRASQPETLAVTGTVSLSKKLSDGGRHAAARAQALLAEEQAALDHALRADALLTQVIGASITEASAQAGLAVIDTALAAYAKRADLVDRAYQNGAITNSVLFEIDAALSLTRQRRLTLQSDRDLARNTLTALLADPAARSAFAGRSLRLDATLSGPDWQRRALELSVDVTAAKRQSEGLTHKPVTAIVGSLNAPDQLGGSVEGFVGLKVNWAVYDGGQSAASAKALDATGQAQIRQIAALDLQLSQAKTALALRQTQAAQTRALLLDRKAQSTRRQRELEGLLLAGRADVATLAREALNAAEIDLALIDAKTQIDFAVLDYLAASGKACAILAMCETIWTAGRE